jgi:cell division protein FtsW
MATGAIASAQQGSRGATRGSASTRSYDWGLLSIVYTLLAVGIVMVFSSSYARGIYGYEDPYYFFVRQLIWVAIGIAALTLAARIPYTFWQRWSLPLMGVTLLTLFAVMALASETWGAQRFVISGSIQPSEPAKFVIIIYIATWLASKGTRIRDVQVGLLPFAVLMGFITWLLVSQPAISTAILIVATATTMFFIAGAVLRQLLLIGLIGSGTFWLIIRYSTYAKGRVDRYVEAFWNPLLSQEFQTTQGVRAFLRGGIFGMGLGNGEAKLPGYLPVSWSDNIFAVIGEEVGLLGALFIVLLFALFAHRGFRTALRAPDTFAMLVATGITTLLTLQAILNIAVAVAIAPPTGVTLPFISYGGSSLVTVMGGVGILLSISRGLRKEREPTDGPRGTDAGKTSNARFDIGWGDRGTRLPGSGNRSADRTGSASGGREPSARRSRRREE